jgi:hypothetical protein
MSCMRCARVVAPWTLSVVVPSWTSRRVPATVTAVMNRALISGFAPKQSLGLGYAITSMVPWPSPVTRPVRDFVLEHNQGLSV